jgi:hypothetical protein
MTALPVGTGELQAPEPIAQPAAVENHLKQLQREEYDVKRKALEQVIQEKLLEAEAQKQGIRSEAFVTIAPATEAELRAYYLAQAERLNRPFEKVRP